MTMKAKFYVIEISGYYENDRIIAEADEVEDRIAALVDDGETVVDVFACVPVEFKVTKSRTVAEITPFD